MWNVIKLNSKKILLSEIISNFCSKIYHCWRLSVRWNRRKSIKSWKTQIQSKIFPRYLYMKPLLRKLPDYIILHTLINDPLDNTSRVIILQGKSWIKLLSWNCISHKMPVLSSKCKSIDCFLYEGNTGIWWDIQKELPKC